MLSKVGDAGFVVAYVGVAVGVSVSVLMSVVVEKRDSPHNSIMKYVVVVKRCC